jgi:hypothetical protein
MKIYLFLISKILTQNVLSHGDVLAAQKQVDNLSRIE